MGGNGQRIFDDTRQRRRKQLTDDDPELPEHDEGSSNTSRGHLSGVDGDRSILCADADAQDEPRREQSLP